MTKLVLDIQQIKEQCQEDINNSPSVEHMNACIQDCYSELAYTLMYLLLTNNLTPNPQQAMQLLDSVVNEVYYTGSNTHISKSFTIH